MRSYLIQRQVVCGQMMTDVCDVSRFNKKTRNDFALNVEVVLIRDGSDLLGILRIYLACGRNKSAAAEHTHLSRPAFYERLARIGRILDVDLDAVEPCLSLHVALLALDALRD